MLGEMGLSAMLTILLMAIIHIGSIWFLLALFLSISVGMTYILWVYLDEKDKKKILSELENLVADKPWGNSLVQFIPIENTHPGRR